MMNPLWNDQMVVMKGANGAVAEFGSSSSHSPNMQDDHNSLLDVLSQNTPDSGIARIRDDEVDSNKSGSQNNEGGSADDDQDPKNRKRKKRYNRHTQHQIQEMEAFFRECPHPDDKQRKELARELGLEPLQVKFWFQNKRTQVKNQHERSENTMLRAENEKLRAENIRYKEAISNASCPTCGGPATVSEMAFEEHNLRLENARLRDEINRLSVVSVKYAGKSLNSVYSPPIPPISPIMPLPSLDLGVGSLAVQAGDLEMLGSGDLLIRPAVCGFTEADKPLIIEIAVSAMDELVKIAQIGAPLWIPGPDNVTHEVLSEEDYFRAFPKGAGRREGVISESSRGNALFMMNHFNLVEILMDANQWSNVFSPIVSRGTTLEVLSTGIAGNYNGAFQVMTAEFHLPSPLVPTRESLFVRYCKQHNDGTWAVADVSLDHHLHPTTSNRFRRLPSGCLIQEMPNGYSKVIWVEHVEVEFESSAYNMFKETVKCGLAFGAKRWIATLNRQSERLASVMATQVLPGDVVGVLTSLEGRKSMLKLAERMVRSFCSGVSASTIQSWASLCGNGDEEVKVTTRKSINDPGRPAGIVLSVATSFWLPLPPQAIFDFLRDESTRSEWDILSNGGFVHEIAHIANGQDPGNCISLLRVNGSNANQGNMLIIQESCIDESGCLVVYAPVDGGSINAVLSGHDDPDYVALLPSGFAVVPDGSNSTTIHENGIFGVLGSGGSLLTVAFQILISSIPSSKLDARSVATVNSLINCTVSRIKAALSCNNA